MTSSPTVAADAPPVLVSRSDGGVARVILNRPAAHNAFDDAAIAALDRALAELDGDRDARAVVLTGAGKSFSAGADLNWMKRAAGYDRARNAATRGRSGRLCAG